MGKVGVLERGSFVGGRLNLNGAGRAHNAFHASLLTPYRPDTKFSNRSTPPPPVSLTDGSVEYEVKTILRSRTSRGRTQHLVSWKCYSDIENQWISAADLHSPALLRACLSKVTP